MARGAIEENTSRVFGRGLARPLVISSASLAVLCLFYVYSAASYLEIRVYPLIDRVTYHVPFIAYIASEYFDHVILGSLFVLWLALASQKRSKIQYAAIGVFAALFAAAAVANYRPALEGVALASLPAVVAFLIFNRYSAKKVLDPKSSELTLNYLALLGIVIGTMGLALALVPVLYSDPLPQPPARNYAHEVFLVLSSFSPVLILLLIASVPVKLVSDFLLRVIQIQNRSRHQPLAEQQQTQQQQQHSHPLHPPDSRRGPIRRKYKVFYLVLVVLLSVLLSAIPHLPTVNPDGQQVGVDTGYYRPVA